MTRDAPSDLIGKASTNLRRFLRCPRVILGFNPRTRVGRTLKNPATPSGQPPCVPHRHVRRALSGFKRRRLGPLPSSLPVVAGGRPFSANPNAKVLRLALDVRAGPASPARLPVYPRRNEGIVGTGWEGGDERGCGLGLSGRKGCRRYSGVSPLGVRAIAYGTRQRGIPNPPPCGEGGRQAGGVLTRSEDPSPTPPHKGEGLHAPPHAFICDCPDVKTRRWSGRRMRGMAGGGRYG
ncbi:Hypothetical protein NGAL_HAMBI2566_04690 [Neorhizobium galegae bv. orientalis]|nr:Hypothetical protein NGAL_HAMBI2566_04690 [Neorhizobium galegae bv. orientalis]